MQEAQLHDLSDDADYAVSQQQILKEVEQMSSSFTEAFPTMQTLLEFRAGKMLLEGKRVITDTRKGLIRIARGEERLIHFQWLDRTQNVIEDSWKLDCSNLGAEAISDVTSSSGPVKLEDLQRILCSIGPAEIAGDPDGGDFLFFAIFNGAL